MRKFGIAVCMAALSSVLFAASASASGGAATVQHVNLNSFNGCQSYWIYTYCVTANGEENITSTSSGNWSGEANATISSTFSVSGTQVSSDSQNVHEHILYTNNFTTLQEAGVHITDTATYGGTTCTYSADVHVTNDNQIQFNNQTFSCS